MKKSDAAANGRLSKEIVILSIIVILYSFQGAPGDFDFYAMKFRPMPEKLILARYVFSLALRALLFVVGVGILFRREIFRKGILFLSLFTICTVYWKHPFMGFKNSLMFNMRQGILSVDLLPQIDRMAWISVGICCAIDIVMAGFLVYFFTRPKIKEQFR